MAGKIGLDYFPLDCHMDSKIELIEAEFGIKGFAIIIKLFQYIYSENGYYCEWTPDISVLWASRLGLSHKVGFDAGNGNVDSSYAEQCVLSGFPKNLINEVIAASIRRDIFSKDIFCKYGVLTSAGIQKRYLVATYERKNINLKKEYLLISVPKNRRNVTIIEKNRATNSKNRADFSQSKVKESKVNNNNNTMCKAEALALFEELWKMYPSKKGKGQVSDAAKMRLLKIGKEEMTRALGRYKDELKKDADWRKPQNGSTFFNSGYIDYLDANFVPSQTMNKKSGQVHQFMERDRSRENMDDLERVLLGKQ